VGPYKLFSRFARQYEIRSKLLLMTNRKLHMSFLLAPRLMTLDDLELLQVRVFSEFRVNSLIWKATTAKTNEEGPLFSATEL